MGFSLASWDSSTLGQYADPIGSRLRTLDQQGPVSQTSLVDDPQYAALSELPGDMFTTRTIPADPGGAYDMGDSQGWRDPTPEQNIREYDIWGALGGYENTPFQSKYFRGIEELNDGNTLIGRGFQRPGQHKYDTFDAVWNKDPTTGNFVLKDIADTKQLSSLRQHGAGVARTASKLAAMVGMAFGGQALAGSMGSGASSGAADVLGSWSNWGIDIPKPLMNAGINTGVSKLSGADWDEALKRGAIGGVSGMAGGYVGDMYGPLAGGATQGAVGTALSGGSLSDVARGAAIGGLGSQTPDVAGMAGVTNPDLASGINSTLRGAGQAALGGGDWRRGAVQGAVDSGLSSLENMFTKPSSQYSLGNARLGESSQDTSPYSLGPARFGDRAPTETNMYSPAYNMPSSYTGANNVFSSDSGSSGAMENPFMQSVQEYLGNISPRQVGSMAEGLMGLYEGYNQRRSAKETMRGLDARRAAYEQQLRSNLSRRDAAAGRRSNYGGREVELQAALAQLDSRNATMLAQLQQARQGALSNMFRTALRTGDKMGWFDKPQQQQTQPFLPSLMNYTQDFTPNYSFSTPKLNPQPSGMYELGRARFGGS